MAGELGVTHFLIFSRTETNTNLRICRVPRGPTLTFRVMEYALAKDCLALQKTPKTSNLDYVSSPLLVLNNFKQEGKQFKLITAMLQNMFPAIDVQTVSLDAVNEKAFLAYNLHPDAIITNTASLTFQLQRRYRQHRCATLQHWRKGHRHLKINQADYQCGSARLE